MKQGRQEIISKTAADMTPDEFREYLQIKREELFSLPKSNHGRFASTYQTRHVLRQRKRKLR